MELTAFLRLYADTEPLRTLVRANPAADSTAIATLFLRPAGTSSSREALYNDLCTLLQPPTREDMYALRHLKLMWSQVAQGNRHRKRFCYSGTPMTEADTRKMWRIVEAMQAQGGSIRDCADMVGIEHESFTRLQSAWKSLHGYPEAFVVNDEDDDGDQSGEEDTQVDEEGDLESSTSFVSTADVPTPVASPRASPRQIMEESLVAAVPIELDEEEKSASSPTPKRKSNEGGATPSKKHRKD